MGDRDFPSELSWLEKELQRPGVAKAYGEAIAEDVVATLRAQLSELERRARELSLALREMHLHSYHQVIGKSTVKALVRPSDLESVLQKRDALAELLPEAAP